jgi:signal transduction histidine kinase
MRSRCGRVPGTTLSGDRVLPTTYQIGTPTMLRRLAQVILAGGVLVLGVLGVVSSVMGVPEPGSGGDDTGGLVSHVDPGSPVWRDGIRTGDTVLELHDALDPGGWSIKATDGNEVRLSFAEAHLARLRHYIPWSVLALGAAVLAALLATRGIPAAAAVLPLVIAATAEPLFNAGSVAAALLAGVAVFAGGTVAVVAFAQWRRWMVLIVPVGIGLAAMWLVTSTVLPAGFDAIDRARTPAVLGLGVAGFVAIADRKRVVGLLSGKDGPAFVDLAYASTVGALLVAAAVLLGASVVFLAIATVLAVAIYPFWRRRATHAFELLVTSGARRDAAIRAVEGERGRLAREIHDSPLQELSGVIRRLESMPGAESEAASLRSVAEGLRDVATSLHPPVLQDLGLAAAIADLGDHLSEAHPEWEVTVDVDDVTLAERPPADVELAAFRVIQEATANAIAHSNGRCLEIGGVVSTDTIELRAMDDGHGFRDDDAREARRSGHFGLDAMRERAAAVGAKVVVTPSSPGAAVQFQWERR